MDVGLLTYASFAAPGEPGAGGGWRVGQRAGGLGAEEARLLCGRIPTRPPGTRPVPRYPSAEEVAALERRMAWTAAPWPGGDRVFWFSSPAGEDGTGRAGNVFTQVHVFREGDPRPARPTDLLFSPSLRLPFGAAEVNAARAPEGAPEPGPLADPAALWPWIFAPAAVDRREVLRVLLDLLAHGEAVALACPDEEAAMWIAAVHLCTSPRAARELTFSTLERAAGLPDAVRHGIRLTRVPPADAAAAAAVPGVRLVDVADPPRPGVHGGRPTVLADGAEVPASAWSALVDELCAGPAEAAALSRGRQDTPAGADPAWFLALAALADPERASAVAGPLAALLGAGPRPAAAEGLIAPAGPVLLDAALAGAGADPAGLLARLEPLAAAGALRPGSPEAARTVRALRDSGAAALALAPGAAGPPPRPGPRLRRLLREAVAGTPELAEAIASGAGLPVGPARWLGIPERTAELLPTPPAGAAPDAADFAVPGPQGALIGAWVLGELHAGTPVTAPPRRGGATAPADPWSSAGTGPGGANPFLAGAPEFTAPVVAFGLNCLVRALAELDADAGGPPLPPPAAAAAADLDPGTRALLDPRITGAPAPDAARPGEPDGCSADPGPDPGEADPAEPAPALAEQPAIPDWLLVAILDAAGPGLPADPELVDLAGGAPQWHCLLGEVLRLPRDGADPLVREAQEMVLVSAAAHLLRGGDAELVDTLPWWRVDWMGREELARLAGRGGRLLLEYGGPEPAAVPAATGAGPAGRCRLTRRTLAAHERIARRRGGAAAQLRNRSQG